MGGTFENCLRMSGKAFFLENNNKKGYFMNENKNQKNQDEKGTETMRVAEGSPFRGVCEELEDRGLKYQISEGGKRLRFLFFGATSRVRLAVQADLVGKILRCRVEYPFLSKTGTISWLAEWVRCLNSRLVAGCFIAERRTEKVLFSVSSFLSEGRMDTKVASRMVRYAVRMADRKFPLFAELLYARRPVRMKHVVRGGVAKQENKKRV